MRHQYSPTAAPTPTTSRRGESSNMPQRFLVGNYSHLDTLYPHHVDPAAAELGALWRALLTRCGR